MTRPQLAVVLALVLLVGVGVAIVLGPGLRSDPEVDQRATDRDADGGELAPDDDPDSPSAVSGPEGTRSLEVTPDEIPAGIVVDGATGLVGQVARGGDDWSAVVSYRAEATRDEVEAVVEAGAAADGFDRRDATFDEQRKVIVYDGEDGSIMTVTLDDAGAGEIQLTAVRVSP